jgi:tetratricopeptide (TPR) repeat protein
MKRILYIVVISIIVSQFGYAQKLDSLWKVYNNTTQADTNRLKAINIIAWSYNRSNPDTAIVLAEQQVKLSSNISTNKAKIWLSKAYNTIGVSFNNKGNFPKALEYDLKALKLCEEIKNKKGIANCFTNIGIVYQQQADYKKAIEYYLKALDIYTETNNAGGIGDSYINIGVVYYFKADYDKALEYYFKSLKIREEIGFKPNIGACYNNIGLIYLEQKNYPKTLEYDLKSLKIYTETNNKFGIAASCANVGEVYTKLVDFKKAILYCDTAIKVAKQIGDINIERTVYEILAGTYSKMGKYKEAYENHVKFKTLTDSIFNEDNSKQLGDLKTQFEVEKKEAELKIKSDAEQEKLKAVANEEKKRQQVIIASVVGVLLVVLVFSLFLYKRFKITQRQKAVIEEQKVLVDKAYNELHEKNKEVMDSIRYAKRIQTALITSEKYIESSLNKLMKK